MFKERLERSTLSQEKIHETTIEKLNSIVSQIHKYIPQDEIENIRREALMEAETDYGNLAEEDKSGPMEARREMDTVMGNTVCPNKA